MTAPTPISARPHVWLLLLGILLGLALLPEMTSGHTVRIVINACRNLVLSPEFRHPWRLHRLHQFGPCGLFRYRRLCFWHLCQWRRPPVLLAAAAAVGCTALFAGLISYPFFRRPAGPVLCAGDIRPVEAVRRANANTVRSHWRLGRSVSPVARNICG